MAKLQFDATIPGNGVKGMADMGFRLLLDAGETEAAKLAQAFLFRGKRLKVTIESEG